MGDRYPALGDTGALQDERRWAEVASCDVPFISVSSTGPCVIRLRVPDGGWPRMDGGIAGKSDLSEVWWAEWGPPGAAQGLLRIGVSKFNATEPGESLWSPNLRECARCMWACPT